MRWVIWGNAGHALVLAELIHDRGDEVVALVDRLGGEPVLPGVPLLDSAASLRSWREQLDGRLLGSAAIGGANGRDRLDVHEVMRSIGIEPTGLAAASAVISSSATIGEGSQILPGAVVGPRTVIGSACIVNHQASVDHECRLGNGVHISPGAVVAGLVAINDRAWIGANATILPRLVIGEDAIVGAGAVVTHDVAPGQTVIGVPARPLNEQRRPD